MALLHPLQPGDQIVEGWYLQRVEKAPGARWVLKFGPAEVSVILERRRIDARYAAESKHYGLWLDPKDNNRVPAEFVSAHVEQFGEPDEPFRLLDERPVVPKRGGPTLYLVPGHIGEPFDISIRAVHVLSSVNTVMVEPGSESAAQRALAMLGVRPRQIAAASKAALEAVLETGEDVCLFGADEGVLGFCDPGKALFEGLSYSIRTIGGPSVLGLALQRVPIDVREFSFLGLLHNETDRRRVRSRLRHFRRFPIVLFSNGRALRNHLAALVAGAGGCTHLVGSLTRDRESVSRIDNAQIEISSQFADDDPVVAFLVLDHPLHWMERWFGGR